MNIHKIFSLSVLSLCSLANAGEYNELASRQFRCSATLKEAVSVQVGGGAQKVTVKSVSLSLRRKGDSTILRVDGKGLDSKSVKLASVEVTEDDSSACEFREEGATVVNTGRLNEAHDFEAGPGFYLSLMDSADSDACESTGARSIEVSKSATLKLGHGSVEITDLSCKKL